MRQELLLKSSKTIWAVAVCSLFTIWASNVDASILDVTTSGNGVGTVTSNPAGIDCGGSCSYDFSGTVVLEAVNDGSSVFTGWGDGCDSVIDTQCTVLVDQAVHVTAYFDVQTTATYYVSTSGNDTYSGKGWSRPFRRIEKALSVAENGDEIWVRAGTYYPPDVNASRKESYYSVFKKVSLYGGFIGDETVRNQRDWENNTTTVSAYKTNFYGQGFFIDTQGDTGLGRARIDGFIVYNGSATNPYTAYDTAAGGGIHVESNSQPIIANSEFFGNDATYGGAISNDGNGTVIINCKIHDNTATNYGGAISANTYTEVINSTIYNNRIYFTSGGGAIAWWGGGKIISSTITGNRASSSSSGGSGGVYAIGGTITIHNSIIWGNTLSGNPSEIATSIYSSSANFDVSYSNIRGGYTGTGNVDSDPLFGASYASSGFTPQPLTLSVNNGSNALLPPDIADIDDDGDSTELLPIDNDGYERVSDSIVDMGAHEYSTGRYTEYPLTVSVVPAGNADIVISGTECSAPCSENYFRDTDLTVEAIPVEPDLYRFAYWVGCDSTHRSQCLVEIMGATNIVAHLVEKTADADSDGMEDWWEYYYFRDLKQKGTGDYDGDGLSNKDEFDLGLDPDDRDTDGDGMADGWELVFGFDPVNVDESADDSDNDGRTNLQEYQDGTNPIPLCGDISDDAVVDVTDLIQGLQIFSGVVIVPTNLGGDCNGDLIIGVEEIMSISQEIVGD